MLEQFLFTIKDFLDESSSLSKIVLSLIYFFVIFGCKFLVQRGIQKLKHASLENRRKWSIWVRSIAIFLFLCVTYAIWFNQLKTFAFSIAAVAAAIAIATKEFILSYFGTIFKTVSQAFIHGDRIEIKGLRGDVVDQSILSTTILEIGPGNLTHQYTGRSIVIPNIMFLLEPMINETYFHDFVLHSFAITRNIASWKSDEEALLVACQIECERFYDSAQKDMDKKTRKKHLESMSVRPRVTLKIANENTIDLVARVAVPFLQKGKVENAITKRFLLAVTK